MITWITRRDLEENGFYWIINIKKDKVVKIKIGKIKEALQSLIEKFRGKNFD